jgi:hypothetical protein
MQIEAHLLIISDRKFSVTVSVSAIFNVLVLAEISVHIPAEISVKKYVKNQNHFADTEIAEILVSAQILVSVVHYLLLSVHWNPFDHVPSH